MISKLPAPLNTVSEGHPSILYDTPLPIATGRAANVTRVALAVETVIVLVISLLAPLKNVIVPPTQELSACVNTPESTNVDVLHPEDEAAVDTPTFNSL